MASSPLDRRGFIKASVGSYAAHALSGQAATSQKPNVIYIIADDLGYCDLHCYGSTTPTPNLDRMAHEGILLTDFYAASPVCSPSRAALLTGRYPARTGVCRVLQPWDGQGLNENEATLANVLKSGGYRTKAIGKWHLGSTLQFLPNKRGFDEYYGLLFSVDQDCSLYQNADRLEANTNLNTLTQRYTQRAVEFITRQSSSPFFLYLAHAFPHVPLAAGDSFRGKSGKGLYADAIMELDWSVGQILQALKDNHLDSNTLVIFSSDHGPWYQGSPGILRGRKGETFEGGMRVPFIARCPGHIPPGQVSASRATALDILPTLARLCDAPLPDKPLDGVDILPMLTGTPDSGQQDLFVYFDGWEGVHIQAARYGRWKLHVARYNVPPWIPNPRVGRWNLPLNVPELYDMLSDPAESSNVARENPDILADIQLRIQNVLTSMPDRVQDAWRDTMSTAVEDTPDGAWPIKKV